EVSEALDDERLVVVRDGAPAPAPVVPEEDDGPVRTVAEAVTARLSTIFPEPGEGPGGAFAYSPPAEPQPIVADEPFALRAPEPDDGLEDGDPDPPEFETETEIESPPGRDLFDTAELHPAPVEAPPEDEFVDAQFEAAAEGPAWPGPARDPG